MSTITVFASGGVNDNFTGTIDWASIGNITADDSNNATCTGSGSSSVSHYLRATPSSLSAIPAGSNINQIDVYVNRYRSVNIVSDKSVRIYRNGYDGSNLAAGGNWPTSQGTAQYTWTSGNWGSTWTRDDVVNNLRFGIAVNFTSTANALINYIKFMITYTQAILLPPKYSGSVSFYSPIVFNAGLLPPLFTNTNSLYSPMLAYKQTLLMPIVQNSNSLYNHNIGFAIQCPYFSNSISFYTPAFLFAQTLYPAVLNSALVINSPKFFTTWNDANSIPSDIWTDVDIPT